MLSQNARNSGSGKIKGARNCGYAQMEMSACTVFHVLYCIEECLEMRFSQLCNLLFLHLLPFFFLRF